MYDLFEKHKAMRRILLIWIMWLMTWVVMKLFSPAVDDIILLKLNASATTVVTTILGFLTTGIGFYKWSRHKDDNPNTDIDDIGDK